MGLCANLGFHAFRNRSPRITAHWTQKWTRDRVDGVAPVGRAPFRRNAVLRVAHDEAAFRVRTGRPAPPAFRRTRSPWWAQAGSLPLDGRGFRRTGTGSGAGAEV